MTEFVSRGKGRDYARMRSAPWTTDVTWSISTSGGCATEKCGGARLADVSLVATLPKPVWGQTLDWLAGSRSSLRPFTTNGNRSSNP